ncbi:MAG: matrixin family metalloprotease [Myxococcaceae bacterium]|nr:matrixin family metalloprotease [Myxococcaceae bacterium]
MRLITCSVLLVAASALGDPSGHKWQVTSPIPYRVFNHSSISCASNPCTFSTVVLPAVKSGFARWTSSQVTNCNGNGPTRWNSTFTGTFTSPSGLAAVDGSDMVNNVIWLGGSNWTHGQQTLGLTTTSFYTSSGQIIDADMELNNNVTWKVGGLAGFQVDVESIVTHEAGHFLGLDHSSPTTAVMYAYYDSNVGEIKRNLTSYDIADLCAVYPGTGGGPLGSQGDPCTADSQCGPSAPSCRGASGAPTKICTQTCTTSSTCPTGYTCQNALPSGKACLPPVGAVDLCKFCTAGSQCSTGQCVTNGPQNWCTRTCMTNADCGSGYSCVQGTTSSVCAPNNVCPAPQCTSNSDCAVGYVCSGGMCTATGNPGDRCEVSVYCKACSVCIGTSSEAYCRACCATSGPGECQSCSNPQCGSGFACVGVKGTNDAICYPQQGKGACEPCDPNNPCQEGYTCTGSPTPGSGRCHATCNPANPGACTACFDSGDGSGVCACPGETSVAGQPCGQFANGLRVCVQGTACVGTPKTCRAKCELGNDATCQPGEMCQSVDGEAVCMPSMIPGQRCSPCNSAGGCNAGLICVSNRCYEPCALASPVCSTCVEAAPGVGICACGDQLASAGQACGAIAGEVYACAQGLICVGGTCRNLCDPTSAVCPPGEACVQQGSTAFCQPNGMPPPDAGGHSGGKDGGSSIYIPPPDAGTAPVQNDVGCGCSAGAEGLAPWAVAAAFVWMARGSRRRRER